MGVSPYRVDIMLFVTGLEFERAWQIRDHARLDNVDVPFISMDDLVVAKKALGRPQDLLDVANIEKAKHR